MKETQEQTKIILDKGVIFKSLDKLGEYKNDKLKLTMKKWEDDDVTSNMFIIKIEGDSSFLELLTVYLKEKDLELINILMEIHILDIFQKMKEINMEFIHTSQKLKMNIF